ncbi:MAG: glycine--tRNA ligase subunit beta, partial [Parvularculaceae bacterium]|nr:glycine--tRNA ligase subunit beta [Parvularculaceae bacterium]
FPWPKSMRWGSGDLRWIRPLKRILCTFDSEVAPFTVDGLAASDETEGHRVMAPGVIRVRTFEKYEAALKAAYVEIDAGRRAEAILEEARTLARAQGLELVEDKGLLAEVAGLVEWPVVRMGSFDAKFLDVPEEAITATMRANQKYFSVRDPKTGRLAQKFVFVANIEAKDGGAASRAGYERVLTARLSDAWFLYRQDLKTKLSDRLPALDGITFFEGLGSVGDKARRVTALAKVLAPAVDAYPELVEAAARLAKADLVTGMVKEFPELQGKIGRYYAQAEKLDAQIADAIRDHYRPQGQEDSPPTAPVSVAVALADKIDTLAAFFVIDKKPTGSGDPFALRRAALGLIRTVLDNKARFSLDAMLKFA